MARRWREQIGQEIGIEEDCLGSCDKDSVYYARISEPQKEEQVHAFILRLLKQMMNPAVVALQSSQTAQVPLHSADHSWHASNRLQKDHAVHPATFVQPVQIFFIVIGDIIVDNTADSDQTISDLASDALRWNMREFDIFSILLGVDRVRHAITLRIQHDLVLDHFVKETLSVPFHI